MIQEVTMYQAVCDRCGKSHVDEIIGYAPWSDTLSAIIFAILDDWQEIDGKLYCPDCVEYDEETDSYKPKKENGNEKFVRIEIRIT